MIIQVLLKADSSEKTEKNKPGLYVLLFLDFEKAFDTLKYTFIWKTFLHFGFRQSKSLLNWIKVFYCNIERCTCILNNGWTSNFYKVIKEINGMFYNFL